MNTLTERIKRIGKYFLGFNIVQGCAFSLVKFPSKWTVPQSLDDFGVNTAQDDKTGGIYFFTEMENDPDAVFDAIEYVIEFNRAVEEKKTLLSEKANELTEIFATEPIERLRTLSFVFDDGKPTKKGKKSQKAKKKADIPESKEEKEEEMPKDSEENVEQNESVPEIEDKKEETMIENNANSDSLMELAMQMTGDA